MPNKLRKRKEEGNQNPDEHSSVSILHHSHNDRSKTGSDLRPVLSENGGTLKSINEMSLLNTAKRRNVFSTLQSTLPDEKHVTPHQFYKDTSLLIFDADSETGEFMSSMLNSTIGFSCAGVYKDGACLMERIETTEPQLLLMDVRLRDICSVEAVKLIHCSYPKIKILLLADQDDDDIVFSAICAGASGYIFKNDSFENILEKLQAFKHGATLISSAFLQKIIKLLHHQNAPHRLNEYNLTCREHEVMNQMIVSS